MTFYPFPALLRSGYNAIHEYGEATLSAAGTEIDFTGDFVPLIPLGSKASILWVLGDKTIATFEGSVYLSSPSLLRLVDVDDAALSRARIQLVTNTNIPAGFTLGKKDNGSAKTQRFPADILFLSMDQIKLRCATGVPAGQALYLSAQADFLTLRNVGLKVQEQMAVRSGEYLLLCSIESGGTENYIALSTYSAKLEKEAQEKEL